MSAPVAMVARALRAGAARIGSIEPEIRGLSQVVRSDDVCLDIGAEYGLYTFTLADIVGSQGHVHAVEPSPGPARWLATAHTLLAARNVTIHRLALADHEGTAVLSLPMRRGLPVHGRAYIVDGSTGPGPNVEFRAARDIPTRVTTLDALRDERGINRVDFIKADVEGAEPAVLAGAHKLLRDQHPALLLEIEARHLEKYSTQPGDIVANLSELGYQMYRWADRSWEPVAEVTDDCRNYLFSVRTPRS